MKLSVNGRTHEVDVEADTPLLWVIRDHIGLRGTRFGCGVGQCGACTVHIDGVATRTCVLPAAGVAGSEITTIEGLDHPVRAAWVAEQVPQCGYCQSGQLMAAAALLTDDPEADDEAIAAGMTNICRCGTYHRIRRAMRRVVAELAPAEEGEE